jgi:hypothetical protein
MRERTPPRDDRAADFKFSPVGGTPKSQKSTSVNQNRSDRDRTRADDPADVEGWANQFRFHCSVPPDLDSLSFVRKYVPSRTEYPFYRRSLSISVPLSEGEDAMYKPLVRTFLDAVVVRILTPLIDSSSLASGQAVLSETYLHQNRCEDRCITRGFRASYET